MRVLCTGDVHLGRPLSQIPDSSALKGISSTAAWRAIVELALAERVDLLAISGDLVDAANRYYEAIGPVEEGIRQLAAAGIPVVAVAGNHDYFALPRIADRLDGALILLGRNQQWERWTLLRDGRAALHVDGWSFRQEHVARNPLEDYAPLRNDDAPVLGLLHADLDTQESRYAPVSLWQLRRHPVAAWLLGHIHVPRLIEEAGVTPVLYPGSPYALDPSEMGTHGVWMATFAPGEAPVFERRPIAKVRYQQSVIDISGQESTSAALDQIERGVGDALAEAKDHADGSALELLLLRLMVTGATPPGMSLGAELARMQADLALSHRGAMVALEKVVDMTTTAIDLNLVAAGIDAPASVARLILALQPGQQRPELQEARRRAGEIVRQSAYRAIEGDAPGDDQLAATMEREAWKLLRALLAQKSAVA